MSAGDRLFLYVKDSGGTPIKSALVGLADGSVAALHGLLDADGDLLNPATAENVAALAADLVAALAAGFGAKGDAAATDPLAAAGLIALAKGLLRQATPPAALVTGQVTIAQTGVAVRLPAAPLRTGIVVKAKITNAEPSAGFSAAVGPANVEAAFDGGSTGFPLAPGEAVGFTVADASAVWVNGQAGDVFAFAST